ncbi:glutamate--tRNA ligase [Hyphococcus lacteus]|uniref:Glutamate--tRNA ligase n=1 Tax=Hyphococcus lacteus TaxID=3143536 RepID=A0ABV3Z9M5_9PROT
MPQANEPQPVITRFAPSPTGYLHIGGARTALFNWLYARGHGGKFLLRIEDTDRARHTEAAVDAILDGLKWLGLDWDEEPVSQFSRTERHAEIANQLLNEGKAYRCYLTQAELEAAREKAKSENIRFESPWREADPATAPDGAAFAIRFKAPRDGETVVDDAVQGRVTFPNAALDDLIILRSDGVPTYNLAVVVDDHDMGITHVVRGDDHLNNAARQSQIYSALGWKIPVFAHVPLIHGQDGAKLSKRHGALGVEAYRDLGYLPEGLANYLLRLGWSHGDEEIISYERAKKLFDLSGVGKSPSRLDLDKLSHVNSHYVAALSDEEFIARATPFLTKDGITLGADEESRLNRSASFLKSRCATLADITKAAGFLLLKRPLQIEGKSAKPLKKEGARQMLADICALLDDPAIWTSAEALDERLQTFVADRNVGFGAVGQPARAALTAGHPSPGLGEVLYGLGREESLARLSDQAQ